MTHAHPCMFAPLSSTVYSTLFSTPYSTLCSPLFRYSLTSLLYSPLYSTPYSTLYSYLPLNSPSHVYVQHIIDRLGLRAPFETMNNELPIRYQRQTDVELMDQVKIYKIIYMIYI